MNNQTSFFFAPWFKKTDRQWLTCYSMGIVICTIPLGLCAATNAFYLFGFAGNENMLMAAFAIFTLFAALGLVSGMRSAESFGVGFCAALTQIGIQYSAHTQAGGLAFLSIVIPGFGILWLLGHHPPKPP
jgi:hypothetical protein